MYKDVRLHIGRWRDGSEGQTRPIVNPASGEELARLAVATPADLNDAAETALRGFQTWKAVPAFERYKVLRRAATLLRERVEEIAYILTLEQGKPLAESRGEILGGVDTIDWFAEEARRTYGRIVPPRANGITQMVTREPVGPVAAFVPWNFPVNQIVRKVSAAFAAGCSVVLKGVEEAPGSCAAVVQVYMDAGLPAEALSLVYGHPAQISSHLIGHPAIRKITFTGSTVVGKQLAGLAGQHMKRTTMELGGHAPALVFDDAVIDNAVRQLASAKFRNAGQVCTAPTRILVQDGVFDGFVDSFVTATRALKVGDGLAPDTVMGPLAHPRRLEAMDDMVKDAVASGANLLVGGNRMANRGYFFEPTVLTNVPLHARIMNEEPFGPITIINRFKTDEEVFQEANRLPYGLAAYAFTESIDRQNQISARVESGMIGINHTAFSIAELPFGGVKDSGYGSEGGTEAMDAYLVTKLVSQVSANIR